MTTLNFAPISNANTNNAFTITPEMVFQMTMNNARQVGSKYFMEIPTALLAFDMSYQRNDMVRESKLKALADNWVDALCDPIKVAPHPEENLFYIYDGGHRYSVQAAMGRSKMLCEIAMDLAEMKPQERRVEEAKRFAKQSDNVDKLSAVQRHDANVLIGNKANVFVNDLCNKYGVAINPVRQRGGSHTYKNTLTALNKALSIAHKEDNPLPEIFKVVCESGWNKGTDGFKNTVVESLNNIFTAHPDRRDEISKTLIKWFRKVEPNYVISIGNTEYPMRKAESVRMTLTVEDYLNKIIGLPLTYTKKHIKLV